jgi:hypothetical protein
MKETIQDIVIRWLGYAAFIAFIALCGLFGVSKLDM